MLDVITDNLDLWTTAQKQKKVVGRGAAKKEESYGIKKLRELILELAVRGKLVPQDADDEPASVLLERIAKEKQRLIDEGKLKKQKVLGQVSENDELWNLPQGWNFVRFGSATFNRDAERIPLSVTERRGRNGKYDYYGASGVIDSIDDYLFDKELLLIGEDGANLINRSTPIAFMATGQYWVNNHAHVIDGLTLGLLQYICLHINAISLEQYVTGTAQPKMNQTKMNSIILAIPPEKEQHRIVAKVDELMALCDQLEQQQDDQIATHQTLVEALLKGLIDSAKNSANEQQSTADFFNQLIAQHFDILFTTEHSIDQLKQTILQLAVMGKLVPQNHKDEPASVLLEKIAKEKAKLIEEEKIKKQKALPEIGENEKQYELVDGWSWARMVDICTLITDGTHQTPTYTDSGRIFISAQNIKPFRFMPEKHRWVSEEDYQLYVKNRKPEYGDILLTRVGAGIGEAAVINVELDFAIYVSVGLLKPSKRNIFHDYLVCWLNSPLGRNYSERNTLGKGVSQGNLNLSLIRNFVVSIPPIKEQHRIVNKVNQLLTLCDTLKANLNQAQTTQTQLADAIVKQTVN